MSEIVCIQCDGCATLAFVGSTDGWIKDEFEADFCVDCQEASARLEEEVPTPEQMEKAAEVLEVTASKAIDQAKELNLTSDWGSGSGWDSESKPTPRTNPWSQEDEELYSTELKRMVKELESDLKAQGIDKKTRQDIVALFKQRAAALKQQNTPPKG